MTVSSHPAAPFFLSYFDEPFDPPCISCDNCRAGLAVETDSTEEPFPVNTLVEHGKSGIGQVIQYADGKMTVLFDTVGYRNLCVDPVLDGELLTRASPDS